MKDVVVRLPADGREALQKLVVRVRKNGWSSLGSRTNRRISQSAVVAEVLKAAARG